MNSVRWLLLATALAPLFSRGADEPSDRHFLERVKPLLDSRCVSCHGPEKQKGKLRLDSRDAVVRGGEQGPALVPGQPAESLLLLAVMHSKPELEMPPKERLTTADVAVLERWIRDGAPWPDSVAVDTAAAEPGPGERIGDAWSDPRNPITRIFRGQRLDLWSLQPIKRPTVPRYAPASSTASEVRHPIDSFIRARLAEVGLEPSREADRRTLARRVAFDLTGLPPRPAEMEAFLTDPSPHAYERLVDRLIDSPQYGEHRARLWLDVVRYSDSNGFDWDEFRPQAWRYRDYVIHAFNEDKPFDLFIREQLAGDELLDGPPRTPAEQEALIATGFLRVGPQDNSAPLFNEQARARAEWMADVTETTGSAFLGLTLSCCRCHDHKYDPLSQADHFRFRAFFQPLKTLDDYPLDLAKEQESIRGQHTDIQRKIDPVETERNELIAQAKRRLAALEPIPPTDPLAPASVVPDPPPPSDEDARKALLPEEKKQFERLSDKIERLNREKRPFTHGLLASDNTNAVGPTRILYQGDHRAERDPVVPGFLSALDPNPANIEPARNPRTTGRRATLAEWIASKENPLTARVVVNRAWQNFFGRGLVATPNDFGLAGARPTHPELLDWLASEFMDAGWSIKRLDRMIVTSSTYRQASVIASAGSHDVHGSADPENQLLWRQNPRRLSAEQLRDALLAVAGTLQHRPGGAPVWPELAPEILQANPAFLDDNSEKTKGWYPSPPNERKVRSLYLVQKRTVRVPFLETFDLPENSVSCPQRTISIVAPQALALLNSGEAVEAARDFACRVTREAGENSEDQIRVAFRTALLRDPGEVELTMCRAYLRKASLPELCRSLMNLNEFAFID